MQFNVDRIAVLAGLGGSGSSGLIKEGAAPAPVPMGKPAPKPAAAAAPAAKPAAPAAKPAAPAGAKEPVAEDEGMYMDEMYADEMVYEISETDLMEALVDMRENRLEESRVRSAVRTELSSIINDMESGSRWLYGNRQPTNSSQGRVSRGFMGPGFR